MLRASNNNKPETVLTNFIDATNKYGFPSRVHGDRLLGTFNRVSF